MEFEEIKESAKTWANDRLKNPYFASVLFVWLVTNRVMIFGLFNFNENQTMEQRVSWVHQQLQNKIVLDWFGFHGYNGFYTVIIYSFLLGLVAMVFFNYVNVLGRITYNVLGKGAISIQKWYEPSKWVALKDVEELQIEKQKIEEQLELKKIENIKLRQENEVAINTMTNFKSENEQLRDIGASQSTLEGQITELQRQNELLEQENKIYAKEIRDNKSKVDAEKERMQKAEDDFQLTSFLNSRESDYIDTIVNGIQKNNLEANASKPMIDFYERRGLIFHNSDSSYSMTPKGQHYYLEYSKRQKF